MDCRDDLTSIDLDHSTISENLSTSTSGSSSSISLFPFINLPQSHGTNLKLIHSLPRVLRPLDSKDVVIGNELLDEDLERINPIQGGNWSKGSIETQVVDLSRQNSDHAMNLNEQHSNPPETNESDEEEDDSGDDDLLLRIKFDELVKIKSIIIGTGGGRLPTSPRLVKIWANAATSLSFSDVSNRPVSQEFSLLESSSSIGSIEYPLRLTKFSNVSSLDLFFSQAKMRSSGTKLFYLGFMGESKKVKKDENQGMKIGAENGVSGLVDSIKEKSMGGQASVR